MTSPAPGWYPDPASPEQLRWWDGQQWSEHTAQAESEQLTQQLTPLPQNDRPQGQRARKTWLIVAAGAAAVALVTTVAITAMSGVFGSGNPQLFTETVSASETKYAYTAPMTELDPGAPISFPVDFDWNARIAEEGGAEDWAFELYLDPALTRFERAWVYQSKAGKPLEIRPFESDTVRADTGDSAQVMSEGRTFDGWGLQPEYYLVRKIDASGKALEQPVVTKLTTKQEFEAPVVSASVDPTDGTLTLSWEPVEGATDYVVVGSAGVTTDKDRYRWYSLFGTTGDTSWSSKDRINRSSPADFYPSEQNVGLALYDGESADQLLGDNVVTFNLGEDDYAESGFAWGVIATDGKRYSQVSEVDASAMAGSLPQRTAWNEMTNHGMSHLMWDTVNPLSSIPRVFAFTGLDGVTRTTQARIPDDGISVGPKPEQWIIRVEGVGTMLGEEIEYTFEHGATTTPEAFIATFNAEAEAMHPATGLGNFTVISGTPEDISGKIDNAATKPADTDYPVYGSNDYVRFIASHLIAGTEYIDVSEFAAQPGSQSFSDAFDEAFYQNPYAIGVPYADAALFNPVRNSGDRVIYRLNYTLEGSEREELQSSLAAGVEAALAQSINDGMSATEKATALNDWLISNAEYDFAALDTSRNGGDLTPLMSAWRADGVFTSGTAVCLGYAAAYSALMNAAGVPTMVVTGEVFSGGGHAWNKVNIDGSWLAVDPTWNDSEYARNQYLLIPDAGFAGNAARAENDQWVRNDQRAAYATP